MEPQDTIFLMARDIADPAERAAFLHKACAGDAALRQRVEDMVRDAAGADEFFGPEGTGDSNALITEGPGTVIGRYKLLQQIGEGGCGVVYMAEQKEPVRRRVALKVIKLGMDTKQVIARFEAERQALALMDHPNIAKVLDAGATDTGRPYFVMELVRGIKITDYCDENNLNTVARLELFVLVCQAIQHAHQKGIIHRDIKPSNILVADHDGVPVPKIIDFGIAKATTDQRLTDKTLFTAFEQFIGTPAYMSPEQARLSGLDIDTRSDIYSLGVLLYELLTAKTPFEAKQLHEIGLDEIRRIIREEEPVRPSTKLQTLDAAEQTTVARHRQCEPPKLFGIIHGDLDWIVMKALEKDRTRRYETANGLAADIQRHLNCEPVVARPPSRLYEFQKTVRRHKFGFGAAAALIAVLTAGIIVSTRQAIRAQRAEHEQSQLRQEAEVARTNETRLRQDAETARASEARFRKQAEVRLTIAQASTLFNSGKYDEAETLLNGIEPSLVEPDAIHADLREHLAEWHVSKNQWSAATTNLAVLVQMDGTAWDFKVAADYYFYATAIVEAGDKAGYESFRRALINRFMDTTNDPAGAAFWCRMSLLTPADDQLLTDLGRLYDVAASRQDYTGDNVKLDKSANYLSRAVVDYRRGNYSNADELIQHCVSVQSKPPHYPTVLVIRAMIHHQLHRDEEALSELASASRAIDPIMRSGPGPKVGMNGQDVWFEADIFLREATALIGGQTNAPAGDGKAKAN